MKLKQFLKVFGVLFLLNSCSKKTTHQTHTERGLETQTATQISRTDVLVAESPSDSFRSSDEVFGNQPRRPTSDVVEVRWSDADGTSYWWNDIGRGRAALQLVPIGEVVLYSEKNHWYWRKGCHNRVVRAEVLQNYERKTYEVPAPVIHQTVRTVEQEYYPPPRVYEQVPQPIYTQPYPRTVYSPPRYIPQPRVYCPPQRVYCPPTPRRVYCPPTPKRVYCPPPRPVVHCPPPRPAVRPVCPPGTRPVRRRY